MSKVAQMSNGSLKDNCCNSNSCSAVAKENLSENAADSDVISDLIGDIGRWQFIWALLLALFQTSPSFQIFGFTFQTAVKDYWCARPDNAPNMDVTLWRNLSQPQGACSILNLNYSKLPELTFPPDTWSAQLIHCTKFEFSTEKPDARSLIEEFSLVCGRADLVFVMEMSFFASAALGSIASGWISDHFGRKHILMFFLLVQTISGTIVAYATNVAIYLALRALSGFATTTVTSVSLVLVLELVSGKWRTITGILSLLPIPISFILVACIAYFVRDWRNLQLIMSLPFLSFLLIWYCMPESPRWLLAQGRFTKLNPLLERAALLNRSTLPPNYQKLLEASYKSTQRNLSIAAIDTAVNEANPTTLDNPLKVVFNRLYCLTTVLNLIAWITLIIVYFGLSLHLNNLGGDIYFNTILAGAIEVVFVAVSIFVVLKFGLRRSLMVYMLVPGVLCLSTNLLPTKNENALPVVTMAIIARCFIGANNAILPSFTAMQYPTVVRNFALGLGSFASGIALITIPYIWQLQNIAPMLPMTIMGVSGIVGGITLYLMKDVEKSEC